MRCRRANYSSHPGPAAASRQDLLLCAARHANESFHAYHLPSFPRMADLEFLLHLNPLSYY